jgi:hypothetical protein
MKKAQTVLLLVTVLLIFVTIASAQSVTCPIDDLSAIWTGRFEQDSGHTFNEYRCLRGHLFWVRIN